MPKLCKAHQHQILNKYHSKHKEFKQTQKAQDYHKHKKSSFQLDSFRNNSCIHKSLIRNIAKSKRQSFKTNIMYNQYNDQEKFTISSFQKQKLIKQLEEEVYNLNKRLTKCQTILMKNHYEYQILRDTIEKMKIQNIERGVLDYQIKRQFKQQLKEERHKLVEQKYAELMNFNTIYEKKMFQKSNQSQQSEQDQQCQTNIQRYRKCDYNQNQQQNKQKLASKQKQYQFQAIEVNKIKRKTPNKMQSMVRKQFLKQKNDTSENMTSFKQNKQSKQTTAQASNINNHSKQTKNQIPTSNLGTSKSYEQTFNVKLKKSKSFQFLQNNKNKTQKVQIEQKKNKAKLKQSAPQNQVQQQNKRKTYEQNSQKKSKKLSTNNKLNESKVQTPYKILNTQKQQNEDQSNKLDQYFDLQTFKNIDQTINQNEKDSNLLQSVQFIKANKSIKVLEHFPSFKKQNKQSLIIQKSYNSRISSNQNSPASQKQIESIKIQYNQLLKIVQSLYKKIDCCSDDKEIQKLYQKINKVDRIIKDIKSKYSV